MNKKIQAFVLAGIFGASTSVVNCTKTITHAEINVDANNVDETKFKSQNDKGMELVEEAKALLEAKKEAERLETERIAREEAEKIKQEQLRAIEEENRKNNVSCDLDYVLTKSNLTVNELYAVFMFLNKPAMAELADIIITAEEITGINAMIISGVIANESSWGVSQRAVVDKNYTGYGVYNDDSEGINHGTAYENIVSTFQDVKKNYLTEGAIYHYGYSTYHINMSYSADSNWRIVVNDVAKTIESIYHKFIKNG